MTGWASDVTSGDCRFGRREHVLALSQARLGLDALGRTWKNTHCGRVAAPNLSQRGDDGSQRRT